MSSNGSRALPIVQYRICSNIAATYNIAATFVQFYYAVGVYSDCWLCSAEKVNFTIVVNSSMNTQQVKSNAYNGRS